jgi:hypothetical protein
VRFEGIVIAVSPRRLFPTTDKLHGRRSFECAKSHTSFELSHAFQLGADLPLKSSDHPSSVAIWPAFAFHQTLGFADQRRVRLRGAECSKPLAGEDKTAIPGRATHPRTGAWRV